jgi:HK97 family phage major capsid protein
MARETFESWIPEEFDSQPIQALVQNSVVEQVAKRFTMATDTKNVARAGGFSITGVAKGSAYTESTATNDVVTLIAKKIGGIVRIADEDLLDSPVDIVATKKVEAARTMAKYFDNATLATSGAQSDPTVPYTSVYKALRTTNAATSYTADANVIRGAVTYANLSTLLGIYEQSDFFDQSRTFVIASPAFKTALRGVLDGNNRPIFNDDPNQPTLFGNPVKWSNGARVSAAATDKPTGNPLLIIGNADLLLKGDAKLAPNIASTNPGFAMSTEAGFETDETLLKGVMRRGFVVGSEQGFALLEKTS